MEDGGAAVLAAGGAECGLGWFGAAVESGTSGDASVAMSVIAVESSAYAEHHEGQQDAGEESESERQQQ